MSIKVAIVCGGKSAEHEVSLISAKNVFDAIDRSRFTPIAIGIGRDGNWYDIGEEFVFESGLSPLEGSYKLLSSIDVIFPLIHGPMGEDGTIQGLAEIMGIPYVGANVLGSSIGMDKDIQKRLLRDSNLPVVPFMTFKRVPFYEEVVAVLGSHLVIKPANMGSSVGISKAHSEREFYDACETAFLYDQKIVIEKEISAREIECAVLGGEKPTASLAGEILPKDHFYSYEAKYKDPEGAQFILPAKLSKAKMYKMQQLAIKAFEVTSCEAMARVDFFIDDKGKVYINELNTIPGFTSISLYPKLWDLSGISYKRLITLLIDEAFRAHERKELISTALLQLQ